MRVRRWCIFAPAAVSRGNAVTTFGWNMNTALKRPLCRDDNVDSAEVVSRCTPCSKYKGSSKQFYSLKSSLAGCKPVPMSEQVTHACSRVAAQEAEPVVAQAAPLSHIPLHLTHRAWSVGLYTPGMASGFFTGQVWSVGLYMPGSASGLYRCHVFQHALPWAASGLYKLQAGPPCL